MTYAAPGVTWINLNSGSTTLFIPWSGNGAGNDVFRRTLGTTYIENLGNNDAQRFTCFTPRFSGFQMGVSYARDGFQDSNAQINTDPTLRDIFDIGANYVESFGDTNVALSGRYGIADDNDGSDPEVWAVGLNLGFGGFTVGGSYGEQTGAGLKNGEIYDMGVSYTTGPWGVSFTYIHGKNQGNDDIDAADNAFPETGNETAEQFLIGLSYDLAKGVNLGAYAAYVDFDDADGGLSDDSVDGFVIGTGVKIKF